VSRLGSTIRAGQMIKGIQDTPIGKTISKVAAMEDKCILSWFHKVGRYLWRFEI
jgi:hypothetical protein